MKRFTIKNSVLAVGALFLGMTACAKSSSNSSDSVINCDIVTGQESAAETTANDSKDSQQTAKMTSLPAGLVSQLSHGQSVDAVVIVDQSEVMAFANVQKSVRGLSNDDATITAGKAEGYKALKSDVIDNIANVSVKREYAHLPAMFVQVNSLSALRNLAADPRVVAIYPSETMTVEADVGLSMISQPAVAKEGFTGAGTAVAVLDTGVDYSNPAFGTCSNAGSAGCNVAFAKDFGTEDNQLDDHGHGTNVAGIVLEVAPNTTILALDVFSRDGNGNMNAKSEDVLSAINWVIENQATYNIVAMNLSLGDASENKNRCASSWATSVFSRARAAGIVPVVAAGNNGHADGLSNPACAPGAVSVGAVYTPNIKSYNGSCKDSSVEAGDVACFSNSAPYLTLLAPGTAINAAGKTMSGTSQAAPHVAGSIAVLRSANRFPNDSVDNSVARLSCTGALVNDSRNDNNTPSINLESAVNTMLSAN